MWIPAWGVGREGCREMPTCREPQDSDTVSVDGYPVLPAADPQHRLLRVGQRCRVLMRCNPVPEHESVHAKPGEPFSDGFPFVG